MSAKRWILFAAYALFILLSYLFGFSPGVEVGRNFATFSLYMLKILPPVFVLIGLFEVWVSKETVERQMGKASGLRGYLWAVLLAGTTVGGLYVAFPVAYALYNKGARLGVIFAYVGASAVCRIPMTIFEASFLGVKFTIIRMMVSLPLILISSAVLGSYLEKRGYRISDGAA